MTAAVPKSEAELSAPIVAAKVALVLSATLLVVLPRVQGGKTCQQYIIVNECVGCAIETANRLIAALSIGVALCWWMCRHVDVLPGKLPAVLADRTPCADGCAAERGHIHAGNRIVPVAPDDERFSLLEFPLRRHCPPFWQE